TSISIACPPRSARWNEEMDERSARRNQETGCQNGLRGLSASQPRMRADTHDGPEQIAPLQRPDTLMQLSRSLILEVHLVPHGRAIHLALSGHPDGSAALSAFGAKADISRHLRRVLALYSSYYNESRTLALEKDAPLQKLSRGAE